MTAGIYIEHVKYDGDGYVAKVEVNGKIYHGTVYLNDAPLVRTSPELETVSVLMVSMGYAKTTDSAKQLLAGWIVGVWLDEGAKQC